MFYDAALDPEQWPQVLGILADEFSADAGQLSVVRPSDRSLLTAYWAGIGADVIEHYMARQEVTLSDPRLPGAIARLNRPYHCRQLVSDDEFYASPFFRHVMAPAGLDHSLAVLIIDEAHDLGLLPGLIRRTGVGPFTEDDVDRFHLYVPHLRRACQVMARLYHQRPSPSALAQAFAAVELATMIVDRFGAIQFANASATELLERRDAIRQSRGTLTAVNREAAQALKQAILEAAVGSMIAKTPRQPNLVIPRSGLEPGLYATISPLSRFDDGALKAPQPAWVAVFLNDPLRSYETEPERLQRVFGLTAAEADVMSRFVNGAEIKAIARETGRSYETVRWHMKQVMAKTGVSRQADLVRLAAAVSPPLRLPEEG